MYFTHFVTKVQAMELIEHQRRQRSSRRLRYEAQAQVFQNQTGNLEGIRESLGLRPSQICELLKVHPSAWTRWTRTQKAPPHVYQMLEWYIELLKWRGQNHPLKELSPQKEQILRQEDPASYVPPIPQASKDYVEKRFMYKILAATWALQICGGVIFYLYIKMRFS